MVLAGCSCRSWRSRTGCHLSRQGHSLPHGSSPCSIEGCREMVQLLLPAVLALSPLVFPGDLIKAGSGEGAARSACFPGISPSCLRRIDPPNTAGAVIAWGPIELPKVALLLEPEFLLCLLLLWIFPCRIPIALCHPRCSRVGMPCGLPAPGFGSSFAPALHGFSFSSPTPARLWKRFLMPLLLIHTHGSYFSE